MTEERTIGKNEQKLRTLIEKELPRVPNNKDSLEKLRELSTVDMLIHFLTWKMRSIKKSKRKLSIEQSFIIREEILISESKGISVFFEKVMDGEDLNAHLSTKSRTDGFIIQNNSECGDFINEGKDFFLNRSGFHHFHIAETSPDNPQGRSDYLLFAYITDDIFHAISINTHDVFNTQSDEFKYFLSAYNIFFRKSNPEQGLYLAANPVTVSGHSSEIVDHAIYCYKIILRDEEKLNTRQFVNEIYARAKISPPQKYNLVWNFYYLDFCIYDKKNNKIFTILEFGFNHQYTNILKNIEN